MPSESQAETQPQAQIRVLLVDDHPPFRIGMRVLLEQNPAITVVGEAGTGAETLRLAAQLQPDVVVLVHVGLNESRD
jgi:two-component system, NarL family, response regulator LiaR